jgi:hypothetical protein
VSEPRQNPLLGSDPQPASASGGHVIAHILRCPTTPLEVIDERITQDGLHPAVSRSLRCL